MLTRINNDGPFDWWEMIAVALFTICVCLIVFGYILAAAGYLSSDILLQ